MKAYVSEAVGKHKATLVFVHGLGDSGQGWTIELSHHLCKLGVRVVCPNASKQAVSANRGAVMPSWFDMQGFSLSVLLDEKLDPCHGIVESAKHVQQILRDEIKLIDSTKVFVGGFSQGACVALHAGLSFDLPLGGIVSCSGWAAAFSLVQVNDANKNTRIQLFHGKHDNVIPLKCSDALVSKLESMGLKYERSLSLHEHGFDDFKAVTEFICGKLN